MNSGQGWLLKILWSTFSTTILPLWDPFQGRVLFLSITIYYECKTCQYLKVSCLLDIGTCHSPHLYGVEWSSIQTTSDNWPWCLALDEWPNLAWRLQWMWTHSQLMFLVFQERQSWTSKVSVKAEIGIGASGRNLCTSVLYCIVLPSVLLQQLDILHTEPMHHIKQSWKLQYNRLSG